MGILAVCHNGRERVTIFDKTSKGLVSYHYVYEVTGPVAMALATREDGLAMNNVGILTSKLP